MESMHWLRSRWGKIALTISVSALLMFGVISYEFVWIPDVYRADHAVRAALTVETGDHVELRQFWNGVDFYTTYLAHDTAEGETLYYFIDPDDHPLWFASIRQGPSPGVFTISARGHEIGRYDTGRQRYAVLQEDEISEREPRDAMPSR